MFITFIMLGVLNRAKFHPKQFFLLNINLILPPNISWFTWFFYVKWGILGFINVLIKMKIIKSGPNQLVASDDTPHSGVWFIFFFFFTFSMAPPVPKHKAVYLNISSCVNF